MTLYTASSTTITLVEFLFPAGVPSVLICSANIDKLIDGSDTYLAHPELTVSVPKREGALPTTGGSIQVSLDRLSFVRQLIKEKAYYPVIRAVVREVVVEPGNTVGVEVFYLDGEITKHRSKDGIVTLQLAGAAAPLNSEGGPVVTRECDAEFGEGHTCTVDVALLEEAGTITAHTDGTQVTVTGLSAQPAYYWMPGNISADGYSLTVHYYKEGQTFDLREPIPQAWQDVLDAAGTVSVAVRPGCRRISVDCTLFNPNPEQMKAYGINTPDRNPILEVRDV